MTGLCFALELGMKSAMDLLINYEVLLVTLKGQSEAMTSSGLMVLHSTNSS